MAKVYHDKFFCNSLSQIQNFLAKKAFPHINYIITSFCVFFDGTVYKPIFVILLPQAASRTSKTHRNS